MRGTNRICDMFRPANWVGNVPLNYRFDSFFGGGDTKMPSVTAENNKVTATPMKQLSEAEKMNKRLAASALTQNWGKLTLGKKGLLGE